MVDWCRDWQQQMCDFLLLYEDNQTFVHDDWCYQSGGGGQTRVLCGDCFEKAGVNFSDIAGNKLPTAALAQRYGDADVSFKATGVSVVIHPKNPHVPTSHANVRLMAVLKNNQIIDWWFGGGFDLTPYYACESDCINWHRSAKEACDVLSGTAYQTFKKSCDDYFYLPHRQETRGIGGLFF